ncbi:MAG TPA: FAD-dependent oxidoreductase, partial [Candidatus Acidoferrales bacterium]|nr:FAD-dependent oxidoreductase [Candidatus Acidoferrales bacterium]
MPKVVVLGAGFAGLSAASELLRLRKRVRDLDVIVVDRNNFMTFTPLLPEAATGSIEMRAVTQPLRALLAGAQVELGDVVALDETARTMSARHPITQVVTTIGYDELILALVGAIEVATETKDLVERDRLLRFVVVGGGFTGVEVAGEITAFLRSI